MDLPEDGDPVADRLRTALLAAGLRVTPQRAAVYDALLRLDHPTAEEVYRRVKQDRPSVGLATIYTALDVLEASGLLTKIMSPDGSARYDARPDDHYHLRCLRTGAVLDLDTRFDPDLVARLDPRLADDLTRRGFRVTGYRLEVVGHFDTPDVP